MGDADANFDHAQLLWCKRLTAFAVVVALLSLWLYRQGNKQPGQRARARFPSPHAQATSTAPHKVPPRFGAADGHPAHYVIVATQSDQRREPPH
jgi:hypothetical protein